MEVYQWRINVYKETKQFVEKFFKFPEESIKYKESEIDSIIKTKEECFQIKHPHQTFITVLPMDTLDCAYDSLMLNPNKKPLVLNMADPYRAGGAVDIGSSAQEENLFRRSNYYKTLYNCLELYPIVDSECIYSPDVTIFRSSEQNGYKLLEVPYHVSIIASAGVAYPKVKENDLGTLEFADPLEKELHFRKICMIFKTAIAQGHKIIILSALGCGAFKCPSEEVAQMFKQAIDLYKNYFDEIRFSIMNPVDSKKNNYEIFKKIIKASLV
jgi:uncharacterized protein (TIGR02452 family)